MRRAAGRRRLLTIANAILGQGQLSLAKYLLIVAREDDPELDIHDIPAFFRHLLERVDWTDDLHFQTRTTIDTLDYSGHGLNQGSKVVMAAAGPKRRELAGRAAVQACGFPAHFATRDSCLSGSPRRRGTQIRAGLGPCRRRFCRAFRPDDPVRAFPLIVIVDDSEFTARTVRNFLWVDVHALESGGRHRRSRRVHRSETLGLSRAAGDRTGRIKPHHAPPLVDDPEVERRVDALAQPGAPLHGIY